MSPSKASAVVRNIAADTKLCSSGCAAQAPRSVTPHVAAAKSRWPINSPFAAPAGTAKWPPPVSVTNWFIMSKRDIFSKMGMKALRGSRWKQGT